MTTTTLKTKIKHLTDPDSSYVPLKGELVFLSSGLGGGGGTVKFGDGTSTVANLTAVDANYAVTAGSVPWSGITSKPSYYDAKAIKSITRSGTTFTWTCLDGTTGTFTQQDNAAALRSPNDESLAYIDWTGSQTSCKWFCTWDNSTYGSNKPTVRAMNAANMRSNLNVPTRTGGDASGTWGISITGSSASCTGNAATATKAGFVTCKDSRHTMATPAEYSMGAVLEFKSEDATDLSGYSAVLTVKPWSDASGGVAHQLAFNNNGLYHRISSSDLASWSSWCKLWQAGDSVTGAVWN